MREIRTSGSEGGAGRKPRSYLYHDKGGRKLHAKESRTVSTWADLSRSFGVGFDSDAPHASSPLRGMSRSLRSKRVPPLTLFAGAACEWGANEKSLFGGTSR